MANHRLVPFNEHPGYGIDAPIVVLINIFAGIAAIVVVFMIIIFFQTTIPAEIAIIPLWTGISCLGAAGLMIWSSKGGKYLGRDLLLDKIGLKGNEYVLDVGTGRGLLMIGAAKRLVTGKAYGVDIWHGYDLSYNSSEATWKNAYIERVTDRIELLYADARKLPFGNSKFDVVISSLVLHNIKNKDDRVNVMHEIIRVLKPGARVAILDVRHTKEYLQSMRETGWHNVQLSSPYFLMFPPVRILLGTKPTRDY